MKADLKIKASLALRHIQRATLILMAGTLLVNVLSFVKSVVIASYYGTSAELDAYFLSLAPFYLLSGVLVGAIHATLIPKYLELSKQQGEHHAFAVFSTSILWIIVFVGFVSLVFVYQSSQIASYLGAGFESSQQIQLTARLLKVSTLLLLFTIINDSHLCLFNAHRRFAFSAFIPLLSGVCSLVYIISFRDQGVSSLMYGIVLGVFLQTGVTVYLARRFFPSRFLLIAPFHPDIRRTATLMLPLLIGSSFGHINVVVDQVMASTLPPGSIAALNYANRLHTVLTQMFIIVISRAVLPFFAHQVAEHEFEALKATFLLTIKRMLYVLLPISVAIIGLGYPIVQLLFQRGAFTAYSTSATAGAWIAYTLGLPVQAIGILTARIYNALQDNKTLMYVAGGSIGLNILFNWIFMKLWGHIGIALSTSGLYVVTTCILLYKLYKKFEG